MTAKQDKERQKMLDDFNKGIICICPVCLRVDIDPNTHFENCDPGRPERIDNEWK